MEEHQASISNLSFLSNLVRPSTDDNSEKSDFDLFSSDLDFINESIKPNDTFQSLDNKQIKEIKLTINAKDQRKGSTSKKKVSFLLPEIVESLSDFDGSEEELEGSTTSEYEYGDSRENSLISEIGSTPLSPSVNTLSSDINSIPQVTVTEPIKYCDKCTCRIASMNIYEIPRLNNLFSNVKVSKCKVNKQAKERQGLKENTDITQNESCTDEAGEEGLRESTELQEKPQVEKPMKSRRKKKGLDDGKQNSGDSLNSANAISDFERPNHRAKDRKLVDHFWSGSTDASLLSWLKRKNGDARRKKREEKRLKRERKRERRISKIDKMCQKEYSDKNVDKWMKKKTKEAKAARKKSANKVVPTIGKGNGNINHYNPSPNGYLVLDTFSSGATGSTENDTDNRKTENTTRSVKLKKRPKTSTTRKTAVTSPESNQKDTRKTFNAWAREKAASLNNQKLHKMRDSINSEIENKIVVEERKRRLMEKQESKKKVSSNPKKEKETEEANGPKKQTARPGSQLAVRPEPQGCDNTTIQEKDSANNNNNDQYKWNEPHGKSKTVTIVLA